MLVLSHKRQLTHAEQIEIATRMQYAAVEAVFHTRSWAMEDIVFHGGTSLKIAWDSLRFSEDIDFMVAERSSPRLGNLMRSVHAAIDARLQKEIPGSQVALKEYETKGRVNRFDFRWSHPMRVGKVMTKVELYSVPFESLAAYAKTKMRPPVNRDTRATIQTQIAVSEIESIMADKLVAIAMRPYRKHRDLYDLWYVDDLICRRNRIIDPALDLDAISHVASIYGNIQAEVADGLEKRISDGFLTDLDAFVGEIAGWMPADLHSTLERHDSYRLMLERDLKIASDTVDAIRASMDNGAVKP